MLRALAGVVWPLRCAGCGRPDVVVCPTCSGWAGAPRWCELPTAGEPEGVWGVSAYGGRSAALISQWKERGRLDLTGPLAGGLAGAVRDCLAELALTPGEVLLVPAPTSRAARRRRGADLVGELAAGTARAVGARSGRVLRLRRRVLDQAGLDAEQRRANLAGALAVAPRERRRLAGRACVVIDDVVTTGATVREAVKVLAEHGAQPVAACCLSVTLRRSGVPIGGSLH